MLRTVIVLLVLIILLSFLAKWALKFAIIAGVIYLVIKAIGKGKKRT